MGLPPLLRLTVDKLDLEKLLAEVAAGRICVSADQFLLSSLVNPEANPYALLFQAGYLTLGRPFDPDNTVYLDCPNREIGLAFANLAARRLFNKASCFTKDYIGDTVDVPASLDPERLRAYFNQLFAALPYEHYPVKSEAMVRALIHFNLFGAGLNPLPEVMSVAGRADTVLNLPDKRLTLVFEYKYEASSDSARLDARLKEAVTQIKERHYGELLGRQPTLARFALVFCGDKTQRCIARAALADVITKSPEDHAASR